MGKRVQYRRLLVLVLMLILGFAGLGYRLVDLQVLRHDELSVKARTNTQEEKLLEPRRGDILDARGNLLATSTFVKTVCADPSLMGNRRAEVAHALAPLLELSEGTLSQLMQPRLVRNARGEAVTNQFVRLKKKVSIETWDKVRAAMEQLSFGVDEKRLPKSEQLFYQNLRKKAIFARDDQLRTYPNQQLAAHLLGFAVTEEGEVNGMPVSEIVGQDGIELTFNGQLAGVRGWRLTETDSRRRELVSLREQDVEARDGLNVVLTLDSVMQHIVESELAEAMEKHAPISISGVVIRPRTGEILAMATLPNYDPNAPSKWPLEARRNRVISDIAEPGSTFKIVTISAALNERVVRLSDTFDCERGHFYYAGKTLHDHEPEGVLTVEGIIIRSSNIGAAKVGIRLGEQRLHDYIENFGFGAVTGLPLPGEVSARLFVPPVSKWSKVTIAQLPMGQGVSVTRMQMLMAMCAIANDGWLMRPMLVNRLEDRDHTVVAQYAPQRLRQVISSDTAKLMVKALKGVVSTNGTAPKAMLEHYCVAGKTGTAQKVENRVYVRGKYFASFLGFFPADNPELCISVTMDEPKHGYYGGQTAAPVFKQIAERAANYLNIRPDFGEAPTLAEPPPAPDERPVRTTSAQTGNQQARNERQP